MAVRVRHADLLDGSTILMLQAVKQRLGEVLTQTEAFIVALVEWVNEAGIRLARYQ